MPGYAKWWFMRWHQAFYVSLEPILVRFGETVRVRQKVQHQRLVVVS